MRLELELGPDATVELIRRSVAEWRPADMMAEVLLRRALGLPLSPSAGEDDPDLAAVRREDDLGHNAR